MKWSGISLAKLMWAVAILAADFGLFCHLDEVSDGFGDGGLVVIGLLPMANIITFGLPRLLWLGLPRLLRRVRRSPFSVGFQVASWASTLAVLVACVADFESVVSALGHLISGLFQCGLQVRYINALPTPPPPPGFFESCLVALLDSDAFQFAEVMAFFSLPPWLASVAVGLVVRRVVVRRRTRAAVPSTLAGAVA